MYTTAVTKCTNAATISTKVLTVCIT
jgi:hypothetical protein